MVLSPYYRGIYMLHGYTTQFTNILLPGLLRVQPSKITTVYLFGTFWVTTALFYLGYCSTRNIWLPNSPTLDNNIRVYRLSEQGENHNPLFCMGVGISLFFSAGSYYTHDVAPSCLVYDEYPGLLTCTLGSTFFVPRRRFTSHVSLLQAAQLMIRSLYHLSKTLSSSLW